MEKKERVSPVSICLGRPAMRSVNISPESSGYQVYYLLRHAGYTRALSTQDFQSLLTPRAARDGIIVLGASLEQLHVCGRFSAVLQK